jgi:hypothetical protein
MYLKMLDLALLDFIKKKLNLLNFNFVSLMCSHLSLLVNMRRMSFYSGSWLKTTIGGHFILFFEVSIGKLVAYVTNISSYS